MPQAETKLASHIFADNRVRGTVGTSTPKQSNIETSTHH
jgi:hypothetical protein